MKLFNIALLRSSMSFIFFLNIAKYLVIFFYFYRKCPCRCMVLIGLHRLNLKIIFRGRNIMKAIDCIASSSYFFLTISKLKANCKHIFL